MPNCRCGGELVEIQKKTIVEGKCEYVNLTRCLECHRDEILGRSKWLKKNTIENMDGNIRVQN